MTTFSLFNVINNIRPTKTEDFPLTDFLDRFRQEAHTPLADKLKAKAFTLCSYKPGQPRKKANILSVSGIVLDIDEGVSIESVSDLMNRLDDKAYIIYSTYSSQLEAYKLRVILPLVTTVSAEAYEAESLALRAAKLIQLPIDPSCQQPAQLHFLPSCRPGAENEHFVEVSGSTEGWTLENLPELEDGDHERFLSKPANSSRPTKQQKESGKDKEIFQLVRQVLEMLSPDVHPIYAEGRFCLYDKGCWRSVSERQLCKLIMTEVFPEEITLRQAKDVVEHMMICYGLETFPQSPWLEKGSKRIPLIALENGTLNPKTGKMVKPQPEHYLRSAMDYSYDPDATCPQWLEFLDGVFAPDEDKDQKIAALQEFIGYLLIPSARFQRMLWMVGRGSNGKSVINKVISLLLGESNVASIPLHNLSQRFQAAELIGKLANLNDEVLANTPLRDDLLKQAVSGDRLQGERKGKDPFYFVPYARFVVAMNQLPRINDTSHGFFRRVLLLPFNRVIQPHEQDRNLVQKLHDEVSGIFVWALEGLQRLLNAEDFTAIPSGESALKDFKQQNNPVELFVSDIILLDENEKVEPIGKTLIADVYQLYRDHCAAMGCHPLGNARFGNEMAGLGVKVLRSSGKRFYQLTVRRSLQEAGVLSQRQEWCAAPAGPRLANIDDELAA